MKQHSIYFRADFTFSEGKIKEYKKLIKEMSNLVGANEPETIDYQFYFDESETRCIVLETYRNPEAVFVHMVGIASNPVLPKIHEIFQITRLRFTGPSAKS